MARGSTLNVYMLFRHKKRERERERGGEREREGERGMEGERERGGVWKQVRDKEKAINSTQLSPTLQDGQYALTHLNPA